ncbi:MAG TPA: glycosyl hydrolase family 18 protein [Puia sp.]|nr:glycosyl hydrolase family 18 protein [Puia sp.]
MWCVLFFLWPVVTSGQELIAYYDGHCDVSPYRLDEVTHVIYAFGHLRGRRMALTAGDSGVIRRLVREKRRYPRLKILVSLGGWGGCNTCSAVFASAAGREAFAHSVMGLIESLDVDGVDIDWEFPDRADAFTALIQALHDSLGSGKELSFIAAGFSPYLQRSYDWRRLVPLVTRVNLMTYDLIGSRSPITGHHAALFSSGPQVESADHALRYLDSLGVPRSKVVIGAAFYAREWDGVADRNHGLFQPGRFRRFVSLGRMASDAGFTEYWDSTAQAAYRYDPAKKVFFSYDDVRSVTAKARYVRQRHLDGIMFWELCLDRPRGGLLETLYEALHAPPER